MENGAMTRPRLKDYRADKIDMVCRRCDRHGVYDRKALVEKFGASIEFVEIRRRLAIGCDRRGSNQCEARFPCLLKAGVLIEPSR
ncbi:hypothetical protein [Rhizobium sp. NFR07]|uniref:hypothetical protein n=1 Tax=Rhizobium sp. NFR07 TaxID=1566262 RepID=UPI000B824F8D|nr:hypothetical protein [Rhizobium sp. NFR07]